MTVGQPEGLTSSSVLSAGILELTHQEELTLPRLEGVLKHVQLEKKTSIKRRESTTVLFVTAVSGYLKNIDEKKGNLMILRVIGRIQIYTL